MITLRIYETRVKPFWSMLGTGRALGSASRRRSSHMVDSLELEARSGRRVATFVFVASGFHSAIEHFGAGGVSPGVVVALCP